MKTGLPSPDPRRKKGSTQEEHAERFRNFSKGRKGNTEHSVKNEGCGEGTRVDRGHGEAGRAQESGFMLRLVCRSRLSSQRQQHQIKHTVPLSPKKGRVWAGCASVCAGRTDGGGDLCSSSIMSTKLDQMPIGRALWERTPPPHSSSAHAVQITVLPFPQVQVDIIIPISR